MAVPMAFKAGYAKVYSEGVTQAVGPVAATGQRPSRSELNPNDANSFFAAPNGNDGNPGTEAAPFLTVGFLAAALTGPRPNGILIRNAFVGDLVFTETTNLTIPASMNIQAEEGEIAYIDMDGTGLGTGPQIFFSAGSKMDGVEPRYYWEATSGFRTFLDISGDGCIITNCKAGKSIPGRSGTLHPGIVAGNDATAITTLTFSHNILEYEDADLMSVPYLPGIAVTNCIFIGAPTPNLSDHGGVLYNGDGVTPPATVSISRCLFWGFGVAVRMDPGTVGAPNVLNVDRCAFMNSISAIVAGVSSSDYCTVAITNTYMSAENVLAPSTSTPVQILTITDPIDTDLPTMFTNQTAGQSGDSSGWRLQIAGKSTGSGSRYQIDSPLYQVSGTDAAPWDEGVTLISEGYNDTIVLSPNTPAQVDMRIVPTGAVELTDILGNLRTDYDGFRTSFDMKWLAPPEISDANDVRKLNQILLDRGTKLFYPLGLAGNLFQPISPAGNFTGASLELDTTADQLTPMIPGWWKGLWLELNGLDWYISDNDADILYLTNPLGNALPSDANYSVAVRYMIVQNKLAPLLMTQGSNFTRFQNSGGGRIAEKDAGEILPLEWYGWNVTFTEVDTSLEA